MSLRRQTGAVVLPSLGAPGGDSGLFLFRPYAADFNRDGVVDGEDLDV